MLHLRKDFILLNIRSPLDIGVIEKLRAGDPLLISGVLSVVRDTAHKWLVLALDKGEKLPFDIPEQTF